jgi:hypothetical protein
MTLVDENAFGLLVSFHDLEDVEYTLDRPEFVSRFTEWRTAALAYAEETQLGSAALVLDLGHALYFEVADGEQATDPITWLKGLRGALLERSFEVTAVLTHGGRWVDEPTDELPSVSTLSASYRVVQASRPSEPLRRAFYAESAAHGTSSEDGWGSGLYVDADAIEALGRALKNAPTPLEAGGATFFRIGR